MRASLFLLLWLGGTSLALANEEKHCNADVVLGYCKATQFGHSGVSMIGPTSTMCAAMAWHNSWVVYGEDDTTPPKELRTPVDSVAVVTDHGVEMPIFEDTISHQAEVDIQQCWALQIIKDRKERPPKIDDAKTLVTYTCPESPAALREVLPQLTDSVDIRVDPTADSMQFFGVILKLVPHAASNYTGISHDFAASIQKQTGAYTVTLPNGRTLSGGCGVPHS